MPLVTNGKFCGICRGGPWDGQNMQHDRPEYRVPIMQNFTLRPTNGEPPNAELKWGTYRLILGNWIWRADADHSHLRLP